MSKKVLLIDDSMTIHRVIDLSIDEELFTVEKSFTADDAEVKYQKAKPDIILLDNKLDGIKLQEYTAKLKAETGAYVIILVGAFDQFKEEDLAGTGADDYLIKPFNSTTLNEKLNSAPLAEQDIETQEIATEEEGKDEAIQELFASLDESEETIKFADENPQETAPESEPFIDIPQTVEEEPVEILEADETEIESQPDFLQEESAEEESFEDIFKDIEPVKEDEKSEIGLEPEKDGIDSELQISPDEDKKIEDDLQELGQELDKDLLSDIFANSESNIKIPSESVETEPVDVSIENDNETDATKVVNEITEDIFGEPIFTNELSEVSLGAEEVKPEETERETISEQSQIQDEEGTEEIKKEPVYEHESDFSTAEVTPLEVAEEADKKQPLNEDSLREAIEQTFDLEFVKNIVREVLAKNLEKAVWEIVPDMAEKLIIQEIERLKRGE